MVNTEARKVLDAWRACGLGGPFATVMAYVDQLEAKVAEWQDEYAELQDLYDIRRQNHNDLDRRIRAARPHIDRARAYGNDEVRAECCAALDALDGV